MGTPGNLDDDLREEYDLEALLEGAERGRYARRTLLTAVDDDGSKASATGPEPDVPPATEPGSS
jgi:hypothetical protein